MCKRIGCQAGDGVGPDCKGPHMLRSHPIENGEPMETIFYQITLVPPDSA